MSEWECESVILMAWPSAHTDWYYMLNDAQNQALLLIKALCNAGQNIILLCPEDERINFSHHCLECIHVPYNDTWARDYGPLTVMNDDKFFYLDFGFNAWGLKFAADKDNLVNLNLCKAGILPSALTMNCRNFILEGGSVETDGKGTLLTTSRCLCSPNRNGGASKNELEIHLSKYFGTQHVLWLDCGYLEGDDTDSHIDTLARLAPENTIIYTGTSGQTDAQAQELTKMFIQLQSFRTADGQPFNLVELPLPDPLYDENGYRLPATYANYLVTSTNIFIPTYAQPQKDTLAIQTINSVFPNHTAVGVDCRHYIRQHGSLHCATMQIPIHIK